MFVGVLDVLGVLGCYATLGNLVLSMIGCF